MSNPLSTPQTWLEQHTHVAGVQAAAISQLDGQFHLCCYSHTLSPSRLTLSGQMIAASIRRIIAEHFAGQQFHWTFDQLQIKCTNRSSHDLLILFLQREITTSEMAVIQQICTEFQK